MELKVDAQSSFARSTFCKSEAEDLIDFVSTKYKESSNEIIAWTILEYLSLPDIELQKR